MFSYKKVVLVGMLSMFSCSVIFADSIIVSKESLEKRAIVKLIDQNKILNRKIVDLEKRVELIDKKTTQKRNLYYVPLRKSWIREYATPLSRKISIAKVGKKYGISKIERLSPLITWGKTNEGWIYISNSHYGKIIDVNNNSVIKGQR